ncbi:MAG: chemotaxis response regulator protein-glutamate methylesterase [Blastocatellia bacterium]
MTMTTAEQKIRVLVVDDSAVMRKLITGLLERDGQITVVGTAMDGVFALDKLEQLRPDVITLDIDMPRADGLSILRQIVSRFDIPVVMLSALTTQGARIAIEALECGAFDVVGKPREAGRLSEVARELTEKVRAAASSHVPGRGASVESVGAIVPGKRNRAARLIAVGSSSGGPHAFRQWLTKLPPDFPCPIVIVQHLPESFASSFTRWLDEICQLRVLEARPGLIATAGMAVVAPGFAHLRVRRGPEGAQMVIDCGDYVNGHRPSVDTLFNSVAVEYGEDAVALIMTGMGDDGAEGIGRIRNSGGLTLAQDEASCMIYGMPRAAVERGNIDEIVPLSAMAEYLLNTINEANGTGRTVNAG